MSLTGKGPLGLKEPRTRHTAMEKAYFAWVRDTCVCCLTGQPTFEISHTGSLAHGKGMAVKAVPWTCLPIIRALHVVEERGRDAFWREVGLPDHIEWAVRLYDIFEKREDPTPLLLDAQARANRPFIISILEKAK